MRALTLTCLVVTLVAGPSAGATGPAQPQKAAATAAAPAPVPAATVAGAPAAAATAKDTAPVIEPQGYTYNPDGRRDPFISLLRRGADERSHSGPRPSGLAGIGTSEVSLRGTMISRGGYVGILQGVDNKSYIVRAGDKLLDGSIRSITADAMVILQQVNDPLSLEKEREVRKLLRQTEEAK
jgi:Tfp pilus assembly protein PilP